MKIKRQIVPFVFRRGIVERMKAMRRKGRRGLLSPLGPIRVEVLVELRSLSGDVWYIVEYMNLGQRELFIIEKFTEAIPSISYK